MYSLNESARGSFGRVNKYLDLQTGLVVAGKHIELVESFSLSEARALAREADMQDTGHLVRMLDGFYDGLIPVLIMEYIQHTLSEHTSYPQRPHDLWARQHEMPASLSDVLEMAVQLLMGSGVTPRPSAGSRRHQTRKHRLFGDARRNGLEAARFRPESSISVSRPTGLARVWNAGGT